MPEFTPATMDYCTCQGTGTEPRALTQNDLAPGMHVSWVWGEDVWSIKALHLMLRPLGKVITKADLPRMGCVMGLQLLDDPYWVLDPETLLSKGRKLYAAIPSNRPTGLTPAK